MKLNGTVAMVTGGAKRVGRALALALAEDGCDVVVHYGRSAGDAAQTAAEIRQMGRRAWTLSADLNDETAVTGLVPAALAQAGRLDILINSAAIFPPEDFLSADAATWDRNIMVNLKAPFLLSQAFARALPEDRQGKIITMLDAIALRPANHHFSYTISKYALRGLTEAMAHALAGRNIQVNGIALGAILPNVNDDPALFERLAARIPAGRTGSPRDVVRAMRYLIRHADYVTGEVIRVDGGRHLTG